MEVRFLYEKKYAANRQSHQDILSLNCYTYSMVKGVFSIQPFWSMTSCWQNGATASFMKKRF